MPLSVPNAWCGKICCAWWNFWECRFPKNKRGIFCKSSLVCRKTFSRSHQLLLPVYFVGFARVKALCIFAEYGEIPQKSLNTFSMLRFLLYEHVFAHNFFSCRADVGWSFASVFSPRAEKYRSRCYVIWKSPHQEVVEVFFWDAVRLLNEYVV